MFEMRGKVLFFSLSLLLLATCLLLVMWRLSLDAAQIMGNKASSHNGTMLKTMDDFSVEVDNSMERSQETIKVMRNAKSVQQSLLLFAESAIVEETEGQTSSAADVVQYASDINDIMDVMLNRSEIPTDYAETMVALFRDKSQGDVIRDFAVQHIGLYAETLQMRGKYDSNSSESATLRDALWDASEETHTIVAAAAFRALADMSAFDPRIDASRLDSRLASCVADSSASPASRVMAAQLCGERRVVAAKPVLARLAADRSQPEPLRLAASASIRMLAK